LLDYKFVRQKTTEISSAKLCFGRDLKLPLDLIHGSLAGEVQNLSDRNYVVKLKKKLNKIHSEVKHRLNMKSSKAKALYTGCPRPPVSPDFFVNATF